MRLFLAPKEYVGYRGRMTLYQLILATMLALTPTNRRPTELSDHVVPYAQIASEIAAAVSDEQQGLPFEGPAAQEASAIALATIAWHESNYRESVRSCSLSGDSGKSVSVFQLFEGTSWGGHTRAEICSDGTLAAKLALNVLNWYGTVRSLEEMFQGYASGDFHLRSDAASQMHSWFRRELRSNHIKISKKQGSGRFFAEITERPMILSRNAPSLQRSAAFAP